MPVVKLTLPEPHEKQAAFLDSPAKRKIVVAGRRGGKTTGMAMLAVRALLDGRRVLEAAPTADQTGAFWDDVLEFARPLLDSGYIQKRETMRLLEMPSTGGRIRCKTAFNADTLRGDYADLLLLDEFSFMEPDAWSVVGQPMLLDNNGDAVFIFTPWGHNHAWHMYQKAVADTSGRWAAWHFPSMDNPYLSRDALDELVKDMPEQAYRQEILAEFLEDGAGVFRNVLAVSTAQPTDPTPGAQYVMGIDWAFSGDFTCVCVMDAVDGRQVYLDRYNGVDYTLQRQRIAALAQRYPPAAIISEANAMGRPNNEALRAMGLPVRDFVTGNASKAEIIEGLAGQIERGQLTLLADPVQIGELQAYEGERMAGGSTRYSAPDGMHDDTVIALALAVYGLGNRGGVFL